MASFVDEVSVRYNRATIIAVTHGGIVGDYLGGHEAWPHCGVTHHEVPESRGTTSPTTGADEQHRSDADNAHARGDRW